MKKIIAVALLWSGSVWAADTLVVAGGGGTYKPGIAKAWTATKDALTFELASDADAAKTAATLKERLAQATITVVGPKVTIKGIPQDQLQGVIAINCPTVLFPYVRETLADAVTRAGFPPVHLAPINFESLYAQQLAQMAPAGLAAN